jgi:hypothetical protein
LSTVLHTLHTLIHTAAPELSTAESTVGIITLV